MSNRRSRQSGVALVLVLSLVAVLGLLVLQFALAAKSQSGRAQALVDRAEADLIARSAAADLSFALLTSTWIERAEASGTTSETTLPEVWNFRSEAFSLKGVEFVVQDVAGLLPLPRKGEATRSMVTLMEQVGVDRVRAEQAGRIIYQHQLDPINLPLQDVFELGQLAGLTLEEIDRLRVFVTVIPSFSFNPGTAPVPVLRARYQGSVLEGLLALRTDGTLSNTSYASVMGVDNNEFIEFYPGPAFRWVIVAGVGEARSTVETTALIRPYDIEPFLPWAYRRTAGAKEAM